MATTQVFQFAVTIPAGTPQASPLVTLTQFEPNIVDRVRFVFPHGCNGLVGIRIGARGVPILPLGGVTWFTTSGLEHVLDVQDMHETGDWSVIGYNTGVNPHTVQVAYHVQRKPPKRDQQLLLPDYYISNWPTFEIERNG